MKEKADAENIEGEKDKAKTNETIKEEGVDSTNLNVQDAMNMLTAKNATAAAAAQGPTVTKCDNACEYM